MAFTILWEENTVIVDDDGRVLYANTDEASAAVVEALSKPVIKGGPEDQEELIPGQLGFIEVAALRLPEAIVLHTVG